MERCDDPPAKQSDEAAKPEQEEQTTPIEETRAEAAKQREKEGGYR